MTMSADDRPPRPEGQPGRTALTGTLAKIIWPMVVAVLAGLAITVVAYEARYQAEERRIKHVLDFRTEWRALDFADKLLDSQDALTAMAAFAARTESFTSEEFEHFAAGMNFVGRPIEAVNWLPRVSRAERDALEANPSRSGQTRFRIFERAQSGAQIPAAEREEYFPIVMQWQFAQFPSTLGFDVSSDPLAAEVMARARDTGRPVATLSFAPVTASGERSFTILWPIYQGGDLPATVAERRQRLRGFVSGLFRTIKVLNTAIANTPAIPESIVFYESVADAGAGSTPPQPIAFFSPVDKTITASPHPTSMPICGIRKPVSSTSWACAGKPCRAFRRKPWRLNAPSTPMWSCMPACL